MKFESAKVFLPGLIDLTKTVDPAVRNLFTAVDDRGILDVLKGYSRYRGFAYHDTYTESGTKEGHITWKGNEQYPYPHIFVDGRYSRGSQAHVALHELAHETMWSMGLVFSNDDPDVELLAESAAALIAYDNLRDVTVMINAAAYLASYKQPIPQQEALEVTQQLIDNIMEYIRWS